MKRSTRTLLSTCSSSLRCVRRQYHRAQAPFTAKRAGSQDAMMMLQARMKTTAAAAAATTAERTGMLSSSSQQSIHHAPPRRYASSLQPTDRNSHKEDLQKPDSSMRDESYGTFAGPAMHTLGVMSRIFRYTVYASVAVVATGAVAYVSVHGYVEYVALHGRSRIPVDGPGASTVFLPEELVPAFSGAHLGGGTDPSLTWRARNAARAAWIALNLSKGGVSNGGASTIRDVAVPDMAWLSAERYLKFALQEIEKQRNRRPESKESTEAAEKELQLQLATLQSKLAGPRGLREARANLVDLIRRLSSLSSQSQADTARWLELQRRLAGVNLQIAQLDRSGASQSLQQQALQQLEKCLVAVLTGNEPAPSLVAPALPAAPVASEKPSSGFSLSNLWSSSVSSAEDKSTNIPDIPSEDLVTALKAAEKPLASAVKRAVGRVLTDDVSTSASLKQLARAESICNASLGYLRDVALQIGPTDVENKLYKTSITTQTVLLQCYLAELLAAQKGKQTSVLPKSSARSKSDDNTRNILYEAIETAKQSLSGLSNLDKAPNFSKSAYSNVLNSISEAAQRAAGLAHTTRALLAEVQDKDFMSALKDYEAAHEYANFLKSSESEYSTMHAHTLEGIRRCREKLAKDSA